MFHTPVHPHVCCSEVLKHKDLDGKIKAACLGSLLPQDALSQLEDQYLADTQVLHTVSEAQLTSTCVDLRSSGLFLHHRTN